MTSTGLLPTPAPTTGPAVFSGPAIGNDPAVANELAVVNDPAQLSPGPRLAPLLDADSIVIVGASADATRLGGMPVRSVLEGGFPRERLLLVNPKYREIEGVPCFASVQALPWVPKLAVLAIRAADTLAALEACHAIGIRAAVSFASGFAEETGQAGHRAQAEMVAFAQRTGMLIAGPNCIGFANFSKRLYATFIKNIARRAEPGSIAVVAQSGNMAAVLRNIGLDNGLRYAYVVSTGNEACIDLTAYLEHFCGNPQTEAVVGYVEQIRSGAEFIQVAARLRRAGKPLFLLKAGNSAKGAEATASHTAAIAGSQVAYQTAFRQLGVATATDPHRLMDLVRLWCTGIRPGGRGVCVVSASGAGCALVADHLGRDAVDVPTLSETTQQRLRKVIPSYGMVSNPVDLTGQITNDRASFPAVLDAIANADELDAAVFYVMGGLLDIMAPDLIRVAAKGGKLLVVIDTADDATSHAALQAGGVVVFRDMNRASAALAAFLHWQADPAGRWEPGPAPSTTHADRPAAAAAPEILRARAEGRSLLTEVEAKALLARHGLPMVGERMAQDADAAVHHATSLGWPVALKVLSPDIAHKTELGGVRLGLRDAAAVRSAFDSVMRSVHAARPDARLDGVVVQQQIEGGITMLLGIVRDAVFGPMMTVGMGGVDAELVADVTHRLLPVDLPTAHQMLRELRRFPLLDGYRGAAPADLDALAELMVGLSTYMTQHGDNIAELELNPVIVRPQGQGVVAVDALMQLGNT